MFIDRIAAAERYGDAFVDVIMGGKAEVFITAQQDALLMLYRRVKYERFVPYSFNSLYVIQSEEGILKVGITQDIKRRYGGLVSGNPLRLNLAHIVLFERGGARDMERAMHKALAPYRVTGEWFKADLDEAMAAAETVLESAKAQPISLSDAWAMSERAETMFRSCWKGDPMRMRQMTDAKTSFLWMIDKLSDTD